MALMAGRRRTKPGLLFGRRHARHVGVRIWLGKSEPTSRGRTGSFLVSQARRLQRNLGQSRAEFEADIVKQMFELAVERLVDSRFKNVSRPLRGESEGGVEPGSPADQFG